MNIDKNNICIKSDSYKVSHHLQTPPGVTKVYSYLESRGGELPYTVFVMLQYIIKEHLVGKRVTPEVIDQAEEFWNTHFGYAGLFNRDMWEHILNEYDGHLPIKIKAVPEGTVVPVKNVLATFENTDDKCASLTNFLETIILEIWAPITVASNSRVMKSEMLKRILTSTDLSFEDATSAVSFMLHDFGFRGVSSHETASILGAAHLTSFIGTDTVPGIVLLMNFYQAQMAGFSVAASEHSTATPWGRNDGEKDYILNMLEKHPTGLFSAVSDSYNVFNFINMCTTDSEVFSKIKSRNGKTVFRPDSGEPCEVISKILDILETNLGDDIIVNSKTYKELPSYIGVLQGDGIDREMHIKLLDLLEEKKWAATTLVYGSGGGLLQKHNRDTMKFAIKCSFMIRNGEEVNVQKDPITAPGKKSKTGRLKLVKDGNSFKTISSSDPKFEESKDEMVTVFENGKLLVEYTLDEIRERAKITKEELN